MRAASRSPPSSQHTQAVQTRPDCGPWKDCVGLSIARSLGVTLMGRGGILASASLEVHSIERGLFTSVRRPWFVGRSTTAMSYGEKLRNPNIGQGHKARRQGIEHVAIVCNPRRGYFFLFLASRPASSKPDGVR
jgi:hypothetical protein